MFLWRAAGNTLPSLKIRIVVHFLRSPASVPQNKKKNKQGHEQNSDNPTEIPAIALADRPDEDGIVVGANVVEATTGVGDVVVGAEVGDDTVGAAEGACVGTREGAGVGEAEGAEVGVSVGACVGIIVGATEGA